MVEAEKDPSVLNFTGSRVGPTLLDIERAHQDVDGICAALKKPGVVAFTVTCVVAEPDGNRTTQHRWSIMPGAGIHELVGATVALLQELSDRTPKEVYPEKPKDG